MAKVSIFVNLTIFQFRQFYQNEWKHIFKEQIKRLSKAVLTVQIYSRSLNIPLEDESTTYRSQSAQEMSISSRPQRPQKVITPQLSHVVGIVLLFG